MVIIPRMIVSYMDLDMAHCQNTDLLCHDSTQVDLVRSLDWLVFGIQVIGLFIIIVFVPIYDLTMKVIYLFLNFELDLLVYMLNPGACQFVRVSCENCLKLDALCS